MTCSRLVILAAVCALSCPALALAQEDDPDRDLQVLQPDFTLVNLPTTLRVPKFRSAFRVTHRFYRPLGQGDFSDLLDDFFGLDNGAQIGLEYRFGIMRGTQISIYRTSEKTIQFAAQHSTLQQKDNGLIGLDVIARMDGTDNFSDSYSPALGAVISREVGSFAALYFEPIWVNNSNPLPSELADDHDTFMSGIAGRIRVRPSVYAVFEYIPRSGYQPGVDHLTFAVEKRVGGHVFQLNFSNSYGSTIGQLARGGTDNEDWYLGFNISRKFF